jgi:hypothetical protein
MLICRGHASRLREANQFAASSPHERSDMRESGKRRRLRMSLCLSGLRAHVRFTAKATELLRRREMTRWAKSSRQRSGGGRPLNSGAPRLFILISLIDRTSR